MFGQQVIYYLLCNSKYFKMENEKYLNDITEIKNLMNKSSRFISLSGLSGILAGIYALVGGILSVNILKTIKIHKPSMNRDSYTPTVEQIENKLILIAVGVILLSIITGIVLSYFKAKKINEKLWDSSSKRLLINFSIPLVTGGILILILLEKNLYGMIAPSTLLFYGLACVNASKYTLGDVRYLGITLIIVGLLSAKYIGFGVYFWMIGFGICHIIYGSLMFYKYDRK